MMQFKDHFSKQSATYAKARPKYPDALFAFLSTLAAGHDLAWDCGTGSGQAATGLATYFKKIIATDASTSQIAHAEKRDNIEYRVSPAEKTTLGDKSVDLIMVAQALHWFDFDAFYKEARRVAKEQALMAAWTYGLFTVQPKIDALVYRYYSEITHDYWPEERKYVEAKYETIPFPFKRINAPSFTIAGEYSLEAIHQYLLSWSASQRYIQAKGKDPFELIQADMEKTWRGNIQVTWPIYLLVGEI